MVLKDVRNPLLAIERVVLPGVHYTAVREVTPARSIGAVALGLTTPFYLALLLMWCLSRMLLSMAGVNPATLKSVSALLMG